MKGYRKPSGQYVPIPDHCPVSSEFVEVALRPSESHTFSDNWLNDPMNPSVCWRLKTNSELLADLDSSINNEFSNNVFMFMLWMAYEAQKRGITQDALKTELRTVWKNIGSS